MGDDDEFYASLDWAALDAAAAAASSQKPAQQLAPAAASSSAAADLRTTLKEFWGFEDFRHGQLDVVQAALGGRDTMLLWPTGHGKSVGYQLVALHTHKVVVVVSPLVSLMEDQVQNINYKVGRDVACFLGSAQIDGNVESAAARGEYNLIYCTPEKLELGFLDTVASLHRRTGNIALFAVDEAHCDFRPSFQRLGAIRETLPGVPIMALTATAVPDVQRDIQLVLKQRNPFTSALSLDRTNLAITVRRMGESGVHGELKLLATKLCNEAAVPGGEVGATIVYVPTVRGVLDAAQVLERQLNSSNRDSKRRVVVRTYHGQMSPSLRKAAHLAFLDGTAAVIVATLAFGMGIDKAAIRRILHLDPPKTAEEYTQQIGRAGRDGQPSECVMVYSASGFNKYRSEFYMKELAGNARLARERSLCKLEAFAEDTRSCRRALIAKWFEQPPPAVASTTRCNCDNCVRRHAHGDDAERDFSVAARVVLLAVEAESYATKTNILKTLQNTRFYNRYRGRPNGMHPEQDTKDFLISLLTPLQSVGLLLRETRKNSKGYGSFHLYGVAPKGRELLRAGRAGTGAVLPPVMLTVPEALREKERARRVKAAALRSELEAGGADVTRITAEEWECCAGPNIEAELKWVRTLARLRGQTGTKRRASDSSAAANPSPTSAADNIEGNKRADGLQNLYSRVIAWRAGEAARLRMAPEAVIDGSLVRKVIMCYGSCSTPEGLREAGVRIQNFSSLATLIKESVCELGIAPCVPHPTALQSSDGAKEAVLLQDGPWTPAGEWVHVKPYKTLRDGSKPNWEKSYERFEQRKETLAYIASTQPANKKPIQVNTVYGHCLKALEYGRPVTVKRLVTERGLVLTKSAYDAVVGAANEVGADLVNDPKLNRNGIICSILSINPESLPPYSERPEDLIATMNLWFCRVDFVAAMKRAGFELAFGGGGEQSPVKRQKVDL